MIGAATATIPATTSVIFFRKAHVARDAAGQNHLDSLFQIRSRHSGDASQWRFQVALANVENPFGIFVGRIADAQDFFVAGSLTLVHQVRADPPYQWMKPEQGFHNHMDRRRQVVTPANMTELVRQHGLQLTRRQALHNIRW